MAQSTEQATTRIITRDGVVTATMFDKVSVDQIAMVLFKGSAASFFRGSTDGTRLVSRSIKDLLVFPFSEL